MYFTDYVVRILLTLIILFISYELSSIGFQLMNAASDGAVFFGSAILVVTLVYTVRTTYSVWRKSTGNESP